VTRRGRRALKALTWTLCLAPLSWLGWRFLQDGLGADPIALLTRTLGDWALRILLASLAMTPLRILFGLSWPLLLRRLLGLFAFAYVCLHFAVWVALDHFFDWPALWADVLKRPYITVGVLGLTLLVPLAATSTAGMIRRLGGAAWRRLHRLVYLCAALGVLHFLWLAKPGNESPYWHGLVLALLLGVRAWDWAHRQARRARSGQPWRSGATAP
jgi:sulfoxide reductase heme-binding subunit YedZ